MTTTVQIAFIFVTALVFSTQAEEGPTCEFEPNNETPETLTCTFEKDLTKSKDGFTVNRYCLKNGDYPESVQTCEWSVDQEKHICYPASPGYSFNASTISNKIVLGIDCLTRDIDANYSCQQLPHNNGVKNMCHYKHIDAPKNTSCVIERSDKTLNCTFGVDLGQQKHGFNVHRYGNEENGNPAIVLSCIWTKGVPGPRCYVAPGYTFDNSTISTNIVLQSLTVEGNYMCQLIPRVCEDNIQKPCKHNTATVKAMCVFEPNTEKPEKLNCTCGGDAEQRKHNFSVHVILYGKNPDVAWSCNWKEDQPTCNDSEGFTFDESIVSSRLVLEINRLTMIDPEGVYRCHVILPLGEYDSNQTCNITRDGSDHEDGLSVGAKVGIACGVVGVGVVVVVVYFVRRRQRNTRRNERGGNADNKDGENTEMLSIPTNNTKK